MGAYQDFKSTVMDGLREGIAKTTGEGELPVVMEEVVEELMCVSPTHEIMGWLIFGGEIRAVTKVGNIAPDIWHVHTRKDN